MSFPRRNRLRRGSLATHVDVLLRAIVCSCLRGRCASQVVPWWLRLRPLARRATGQVPLLCSRRPFVRPVAARLLRCVLVIVSALGSRFGIWTVGFRDTSVRTFEYTVVHTLSHIRVHCCLPFIVQRIATHVAFGPAPLPSHHCTAHQRQSWAEPSAQSGAPSLRSATL